MAFAAGIVMQVTPTTSSPISTPVGTTSSSKASSSGSSSGSSATTSTTSASAASGMVDYDSFLQLLVAELQNQDPTNPTDPTQYMSQLASFSSVGQAIQTNNKLDTMLTTSALSQAEGAVGRTVTSADGKTTGVVTSVAISSSGQVVATLKGGGTLLLGPGISIS